MTTGREEKPNAVDVLLVVPPFRSIVRPALGVSQMQSVLRATDIRSRILYLNLAFADIVGAHLHERIAARYQLALGDFMFSCVVFERPPEDAERYVDDVFLRGGHGLALADVLPKKNAVRMVREMTALAREFTANAVDEILAARPRLVGFTSSYQENMACIALAKELKARAPDVVTVMGGANCQGVMGEELLARFPCIDFVGNGECDLALRELARAVLDRRAPGQIAGIVSRGAAPGGGRAAKLTQEEFEALPVPDFSDYFDQLRRCACAETVVPGLVLETSRGCWWGSKQQCRFCGLNGSHLDFRSRSPGRVLSEIREQTSRHGVRSIEVVDNIVDMAFFRTLFPRLAAEPQGRFFWETGGSLTREQVQLLADAGVTHIQAGIESLSDRSLKLMNKPTSAARNIQTLKWSAGSGVNVLWSHLFGVPGEDGVEVEQLARLVECIHHLKPPSAAHIVRIQRFSRYFESPAEYGFEGARPASFYTHIYAGFPPESLSRLAYHFDHESRRTVRDSGAFRRLDECVNVWRKAWRRSRLLAFPRGDALVVVDTRPCARKWRRRLRGAEREVLEFCDKARTRDEVGARVPGCDGALDALVHDRLVVAVGEQYLSLPVILDAGKRPGRIRGRMPGGHLKRPGAGDVVRLLRRMRVSGPRLGISMLRNAPALMSWAAAGASAYVMDRIARALSR